MCCEYYRLFALERAHGIPQLAARNYVKAERRLVEEQYLRIAGERHCNAKPSLPAARELSGLALFCLAELELFAQRLHPHARFIL